MSTSVILLPPSSPLFPPQAKFFEKSASGRGRVTIPSDVKRPTNEGTKKKHGRKLSDRITETGQSVGHFPAWLSDTPKGNDHGASRGVFSGAAELRNVCPLVHEMDGPPNRFSTCGKMQNLSSKIHRPSTKSMARSPRDEGPDKGRRWRGLWAASRGVARLVAIGQPS
ncbi:hypothetical protein, partial [Thiomonas sp.]